METLVVSNAHLINIAQKVKEERNRLFSQEEFKVLDLNDLKNYNLEEIKSLISQYYTFGYSVFKINNNNSEEVIAKLSKLLNLGELYVPYNYLNNKAVDYSSNGINVISSKVNHTWFSGSNEQRLHSDGSVNDIGFIKSSLLICEQDAVEGGDTILFDSVGAFIELVESDIDAAMAMLNDDSLKRIADLGGHFEKIGPAYGIENNEIITRLTLDHNSDWEYGIARVKHLDRAYNFMINAARPGSAYYKQLKIGTNHGILMANDKIAHGRTQFVETETHKRKMVRGLFTTRPSI